ncbi:MAG TPA: transcriptional regulator [Janthinobacterium sp.]|nr:transcriptional regulator [Janthinobacterium sp.]
MFIDITSPQELGLLIRATRKHQKIRMDDVAGSAGVGPVFVREVERGKETVQLGRVMQILAELGIELKADVPDEVMPALALLRRTGVKPLTRRKPARKDASAKREADVALGEEEAK